MSAQRRRLTIPPEAGAAQARSSDPAASVWVSANAGAGKTHVLTERVVRLLLSGVAPRTILCLTYTNAAAAEMAQRVFAELATLATLPDEALAARVAALAPQADGEAARARARTLFAETLETPGGLKVQTLHAFAASLLRRFPLEANVSGSFRILDDGTREELTDRAIAMVLARGAAAPQGAVGACIAALLPHVSDIGLSAAIKAALAERSRLTAWLRDGAGAARLEADLARALSGAGAPDAAAALDANAPAALDADECRALAAFLCERGLAQATAERINAALGCEEAHERAGLWADIFMRGDEPRSASRLVPKAAREAFPGIEARIEAEQARLLAQVQAERARNVAAATVPLVQLAWMTLETLEADKRRRGFIDYDDQIERAMTLVQTASAAAWVRFKLDEGIDHVMVDEAQDTSPAQWQLVGALTEEFFAGAGARTAHRTLFVVGDEKQSIYSFQGAAPHLFAARRTAYGSLAEAAALPFREVGLSHSFRSSAQVLSAVDRVFAAGAPAEAVGAGARVRHVAIEERAGGVDVWPLFCDSASERPEAWDAPFDTAPDHAGVVKLVRAIADQILAWTVEGPDGGPPIAPGDVMILSRRREPFATLMNRELRRRAIPATGTDRLDVTRHIAVQDMLALARALISPDDLSLAAVLRSPLFDLSEERLLALAHGRRGSLLAALESGDDDARAIHRTLSRWRRLARTERPFDVLAAILIGEGRRADFAARLGSEAQDALDALLDMALDFESRGTPTLETFLMRLSKTHSELRRTTDAGGQAVRVMTVHGAKGLEAPVVVLADVGSSAVPAGNRPRLVPLPLDEREVLAFAPTRQHRAAAVQAALDARTQAELAEHYRLLYVGMTRAERHLLVCGAYGTRRPPAEMWHALVWEALAPEAAPLALAHGEGLAWRQPPAAGQPFEAERVPAPAPPPQVPQWLHHAAQPLPGTPEPLVPSEGEHAVAEGPALRRRPLPAAEFGALLHALLEREESAAAMAERIRAAHPSLGEAAVAAIVAEAQATLALPELDAPRIAREMDLFGDVRLADGTVRRASGRLDRLQISGGGALIVDFKTDAAVPAESGAVPATYRRQLAVYRALATAVLPHMPIATAIVWTAAPAFMAMDAVLETITPVHPTAAA